MVLRHGEGTDGTQARALTFLGDTLLQERLQVERRDHLLRLVFEDFDRRDLALRYHEVLQGQRRSAACTRSRLCLACARSVAKSNLTRRTAVGACACHCISRKAAVVAAAAVQAAPLLVDACGRATVIEGHLGAVQRRLQSRRRRRAARPRSAGRVRRTAARSRSRRCLETCLQVQSSPVQSGT